MKLKINTKDSKEVTVCLEGDCLRTKNEFGSQVLLPLIVKLLKDNNKSLSDLDEIMVDKGPGSFTGLRVGVSVANALGFALNIPVNGKKLETELRYS